jgi:polyisoprenoid-binding protein YceI
MQTAYERLPPVPPPDQPPGLNGYRRRTLVETRHCLRWITALSIFLLPAVHAADTPLLTTSGSHELCTPFMQRDLYPSTVQHMLDAASKGNLYRVEPTSSSMGFCVDSPIGLIEGEFTSFKGGFTLENDAAGTTGTVMMLVETASLETRGFMVEKLLEGDGFFDSRQFPEFIFVSTGFYWVNDSEAVLIGDLTIRDVTRSVGFHVELNAQDGRITDRGQRVKITASTRIRRSEFGIVSLASLASDDVTLCMQVEAVRYPAL